MTFDRMIGFLTFLVALATFWVAVRGLRHAKVGADAAEASLKQLKKQEAQEALSEVEKLLLALAAERGDRTFFVPAGPVPNAFVPMSFFSPGGPPFIPLVDNEIEHLLHLELLEEAGETRMNGIVEIGVDYPIRNVQLTNKGFLKAQALRADIQKLLTKHQINSPLINRAPLRKK